MKVLWFSVVEPREYIQDSGFNGGGWIGSLQRAIMHSDTNINLGIAFESKSTINKRSEGVSYFPINAFNTKIKKIKKAVSYKNEEAYIIPECLKIIEVFKPDIIHIFGSEWAFGLIPEHTSVPCIIHMQGSLPSYYNARFPPGISMLDILLSSKLSIKEKILFQKFSLIMKGRAQREKKILKYCQNFMGRTHWDKSIVKFYNPNSKYFHVEEALRQSFYDNEAYWKYKKRNKLIFCSTISGPLYKGVDLILKSAKLLKLNTRIDFEWRVFGIKTMKFFEKNLSINAKDVNVNIMGILSEYELKNQLLDADFYIHPSYIDNSPNSVCEAQIVGTPVICTNVGGVSSLVKHNETGFLVPANDPLKLCSIIANNAYEEEKLKKISSNQRVIAIKRHDTKSIIEQLMRTYKDIINNELYS